MHSELESGAARPGAGLADVAKLTYTRMILQESMRLYPAVHTLAFREAQQDDVVCGMKIPKGALVTIMPWLIHRSRKYWESPERFDPERFSPEASAEARPAHLSSVRLRSADLHRSRFCDDRSRLDPCYPRSAFPRTCGSGMRRRTAGNLHSAREKRNAHADQPAVRSGQRCDQMMRWRMDWRIPPVSGCCADGLSVGTDVVVRHHVMNEQRDDDCESSTDNARGKPVR